MYIIKQRERNICAGEWINTKQGSESLVEALKFIGNMVGEKIKEIQKSGKRATVDVITDDDTIIYRVVNVDTIVISYSITI